MTRLAKILQLWQKKLKALCKSLRANLVYGKILTNFYNTINYNNKMFIRLGTDSPPHNSIQPKPVKPVQGPTLQEVADEVRGADLEDVVAHL